LSRSHGWKIDNCIRSLKIIVEFDMICKPPLDGLLAFSTLECDLYFWSWGDIRHYGVWWWFGGGLWVLNKARWLGWLQGKVKSPSSSTSGGDSPAETIGPPTPVTSGSSGETPTSVSEASSLPQQPSQEKPQRPFSLKVWYYTSSASVLCRQKTLNY
jgi:hypothetical protein